MADLNNGPLDYTSRDYASLRDDMIDAVQKRVPEWDSTDPNDFLRVLVEAFAYVGDVTSYYIDRVANESFLPTATQRQSLLNIARTLGYTSSGPIAAGLTLTASNSDVVPVTVPSGTQFYGSYNRDGVPVTVTFEAIGDTVVPASSSVAIQASEGATQRGDTALQTNGDPVGVVLYRADGVSVSDGSPDQEFLISDGPVVEGSVRVWTHSVSSTDGTEYTYSANLIDADPNDTVFTLIRDANDKVTVVFGDGTSGAALPAGHQVRAIYVLGGGPNGNVPAGTVTSVGLSPTGATINASVRVNHTQPAVGGADSESNASIRANAYLTLRTKERAVSLKDFNDLAVKRGGISRANTIGSSMSNIICYVTPEVSGTDLQPGYIDATVLVTNRDITANVATLTVPTGHGITAGQIINVSGIGSPFDGVWVVSAVTATTVKFAVTWPNIGTGACSGSIFTVGSEAPNFTTLRSFVQTLLSNAAPFGTGVTVAGPTYTDLYVRVTVYLGPNVRQTVGVTQVKSAILGTFNVNDRGFGETVFDSDVVSAAVASGTVSAVRVTTFTRGTTYSTGSAAYLSGTPTTSVYDLDEGSLVGAPYEIFRLLPQNLFVTTVGGIPDVA